MSTPWHADSRQCKTEKQVEKKPNNLELSIRGKLWPTHSFVPYRNSSIFRCHSCLFYLVMSNYTLPSVLGTVPRCYASSRTNSRGTRHLNPLHGRSTDNFVIYEAVLRYISFWTRDSSEVNWGCTPLGLFATSQFLNEDKFATDT